MASDAEKELRELREAVLDDWLVVTMRTAGALAAFQRTFSWRVTRPLRLMRRFQMVARDNGIAAATDLTAVAVARRLGRR